MPATLYPRVLAFVEGSMERLFFNNNFHYVDVVSLSNGNGWTVETLCNQIGTKFAVKSSNPDLIVVWLDMEKQTCSPQHFRDAIRSELVCRGALSSKIAICLPNRMTENIILADEEVISGEFGKTYTYHGDGNHGKNILKQLYLETGKSYRETFHGVTLLKKVRLSRAARRSPCVEAFLADIHVPCWWI